MHFISLSHIYIYIYFRKLWIQVELWILNFRELLRISFPLTTKYTCSNAKAWATQYNPEEVLISLMIYVFIFTLLSFLSNLDIFWIIVSHICISLL